MLITVIVPTYQRIQDLSRCLDALKRQTHVANQVLVIVRDTDHETWEFLNKFDAQPLPLSTLSIDIPGQVAALNAGLKAAIGDIIAIIDDDAAAHADWLERIEAHFQADARLGGLGGRDWMYLRGELQGPTHPSTPDIVGKLQWFGRIISNHNVGTGECREVDFLKGANMSFRRTAIAGLRFDERLRGTGAQVYNDYCFCQRVKQGGWKLIYDPAVAVDHYLAPRFDESQRGKFNAIAASNAAHNEALMLLDCLPPGRRYIYLLWVTLVGTRAVRGFVQAFRFLPKEGMLTMQRWFASAQGIWQGWQTWRQTSNQEKLS